MMEPNQDADSDSPSRTSFLRDDTRAVSEVIGFILIFSILIISFTIYQALIVPEQNKQAEIEHNQQAQADLLNIRDSILRTGSAGVPQSTRLALAATYPKRSLALNLGVPGGRIATREPAPNPSKNPPNQVILRNVTAVDTEVADYIGNNVSVPTKSLVYTPAYTYYNKPPSTVITGGAGAVINQFGDANITVADQLSVSGSTVTVMSLAGTLNEARSGTGASVSVDTTPVSVATNRVTIQPNKTGRKPTLYIPTRITSASTWNATGFAAQDSVLDVSETPGNYVAVTLKSKQYTLRMMQVGVGNQIPDQSATYITDTERLSGSVSENSDNSVVIEVRDRFNNLVDNSQVKVSIEKSPQGGVVEYVANRSQSGTEGEQFTVNTSAGIARFEYQAPDVSQSDDREVRLNFSLPDTAPSAQAQVVINSTVLANAGTGGSGGGSGSGGNSGDEAGRGGDTNYANSNTQSVTNSGGRWFNITDANKIDLTEPRFTPLQKDSGDPKQDTRYLKLGFTLVEDTSDNVDHKYFFIVDISYKPGDRSNDKGKVYIYEQSDTGSTTKIADGTQLKQGEVSKFINGNNPLELLKKGEYKPNALNKKGEFNRISQELKDDNPDEIFFTLMRGRAKMKVST